MIVKRFSDYIDTLVKNKKLNEKIEKKDIKIKELEKNNEDLMIELAITNEMAREYKDRLDRICNFIVDHYEELYYSDELIKLTRGNEEE